MLVVKNGCPVWDNRQQGLLALVIKWKYQNILISYHKSKEIQAHSIYAWCIVNTVRIEGHSLTSILVEVDEPLVEGNYTLVWFCTRDGRI